MKLTASDLQSHARTLVTGYIDNTHELARLKERASEIAQLRAQLAASTTRFDVRAGLYGETPITDLHQQILNAQHDEAEFAAINRLQEVVLSEQGAAREAAKFKHAPEDVAPALEWLHEQLGELMAEVRALDAELGSTNSAAEALFANRGEAWIQLEECVRSYEAIRSTQHYVTFRLAESDHLRPGSLYELFGYVRDSYNLEHAVTTGKRLSSIRFTGHAALSSFVEWLQTPAEPIRWKRAPNEVWPAGDHATYLRWLASTGQAWVPTITQLEETNSLINAMRAPMHSVQGALEAFDEYHRTRELEPPLATAHLRDIPTPAREPRNGRPASYR